MSKWKGGCFHWLPVVATWEIVRVFYSKHRNCIVFLHLKAQQAGSIDDPPLATRSAILTNFAKVERGVFLAPFWWFSWRSCVFFIQSIQIASFSFNLKSNKLAPGSMVRQTQWPTGDKKWHLDEICQSGKGGCLISSSLLVATCTSVVGDRACFLFKASKLHRFPST